MQARSALALTLAADQILVVARAAFGRRRRQRRGGAAVAVGAEEIYRNPERAGALLAEALEAAGLREKRCAVARAAGLGADGFHGPAGGQPGGFARLPGIARRTGIFHPAGRTAPGLLPLQAARRHAARHAGRAAVAAAGSGRGDARGGGRAARGVGLARARRRPGRCAVRRCTSFPTAARTEVVVTAGGGRGGVAFAARPGDGSERRRRERRGAGRSTRRRFAGKCASPWAACRRRCRNRCARCISAGCARPRRCVRAEAGEGLQRMGLDLVDEARARGRRSAGRAGSGGAPPAPRGGAVRVHRAAAAPVGSDGCAGSTRRADAGSPASALAVDFPAAVRVLHPLAAGEPPGRGSGTA